MMGRARPGDKRQKAHEQPPVPGAAHGDEMLAGVQGCGCVSGTMATSTPASRGAASPRTRRCTHPPRSRLCSERGLRSVAVVAWVEETAARRHPKARGSAPRRGTGRTSGGPRRANVRERGQQVATERRPRASANNASRPCARDPADPPARHPARAGRARAGSCRAGSPRRARARHKRTRASTPSAAGARARPRPAGASCTIHGRVASVMDPPFTRGTLPVSSSRLPAVPTKGSSAHLGGRRGALAPP